MSTKQKILANLTVIKSSGYHYISIPDFPKKMMTNKKAQDDNMKMFYVTARTNVPWQAVARHG